MIAIAGLQSFRRQNVRLVAVLVLQQGDAAVRFGSYSIATTVAQTLSLMRLKSMMRYMLLVSAAPEARLTMPWLLRPPFLASGCSSDFSGFFLRSVISAKSLTDPPPARRHRFVLANAHDTLAISASVSRDRSGVATRRAQRSQPRRSQKNSIFVVRMQLDDRLLPVRQPALLKR